jgi:hypothetical protein
MKKKNGDNDKSNEEGKQRWKNHFNYFFFCIFS